MMTDNAKFLSDEFELLEEAIAEIQPKLVVIDPWTSFVNTQTDTNRSTSVRDIMVKIRKLAKRTDCSIILISHVSKHKSAGNINYAANGSVDLINVSRSALTIIKDKNPEFPDIKDARILIHTKSNKAIFGNSICYRTTNDTLTWGKYSDIDVEILEELEHSNLDAYKIAEKQHKAKDDFSDVLRAIVTIRKSFSNPVLKVTYSDITKAAMPLGEKVWKGRVRAQRRQIIESLQKKLYNDYNITIEFPEENKPFSQLYDKSKTGHGFYLSNRLDNSEESDTTNTK
jgi:hypothetical protein